MKYPCNECLIGVTCIKACEKITKFIELKGYSYEEMIRDHPLKDATIIFRRYISAITSRPIIKFRVKNMVRKLEG
ncbi:MAG: hypothetical protein ACFFG0_00115 [Candidatus Thorarchaeota archaeon]